MELLSNGDYYILKDGERSLWCSRHDTSLTPKPSSQIATLNNVNCLGIVYGLIGKFQDNKLLLIRQRQLVGHLPAISNLNGKDGSSDATAGHEVYKVQKIAIVHLTNNSAGAADPIADLCLDLCKFHHPIPTGVGTSGQFANAPGNHHDQTSAGSESGVQKTWHQIKSATSHVKPRVVGKMAAQHIDPKEKFEKRILDELLKMFNDTDSFYYSPTGDLTNSLQRQQLADEAGDGGNANLDNVRNANTRDPWKRVDDRFFMNKFMLSSLIEREPKLPEASHWIVAIIQGFVQIEKCQIDVATIAEALDELHSPMGTDVHPAFGLEAAQEYDMILISRRSRFRAGTRYKRRGVDEEGRCANYVETEQIFCYWPHIVSFVQVRGSIPVYWSQPGHKYRPPPRLDRNEEETQLAFEKHFQGEFQLYHNSVIISLIEQVGRERIVGDAYLSHILRLNSPNVTYITFDFHEYCRGMRFENISLLLDNLKEILREMGYSWLHKDGSMCDQKGVFRINCIDCLDRTNIVQTAIAKAVMDIQFVRLGLLPPEGLLPSNCRRAFQTMWANNGDIISRQYAGTVALKGDFTRTGERRFAGVMKDGYNSASRYYMNRFKDAYRQAAIDLMLGIPISEDLSSPDSDMNESNLHSLIDDQEHHERVKLVIDDCKKILIPDNEIVLGGWPLADADPVTGSSGGTSCDQDMDTVLVLTKESYYVAEYDDQTDRIIKYQRVLLEDLEKIELGAEPNQIFSMKSKQNYCLRIHYLANGQSGYFHMLRSTNTRFFNNMAIPIKTSEESMESLKAIYESFKVALSVKSLNVPFFEGKLERRKSKLVSLSHRSAKHASSNRNLSLSAACGQLPRNISDGQLLNLKTVGARALTNVSSHLKKIKGKWGTNRQLEPLNEPPTQPTSLPIQIASPSVAASFHVDSSGEEDSEDDSMRILRKNRHRHGRGLMTNSTSSGIFIRTLSSDYSEECSDIDDQEAVTPVVDHFDGPPAADTSGINHDTLLESCGILATSPPLNNNSDLVFDEEDSCHSRSLFHSVDDFVLDAMKKQSLKQLQRKASESISSIPSSPTLSMSDAFTSMPSIQVSDFASHSKEMSSSSCHLLFPAQVCEQSRTMSRSTEDLETGRIATAIKQASTTNSTSCMDIPRVSTNTSSGPESRFLDEVDRGGRGGVAANSLNVQSKMKTSHSETAIQDFSLSNLSLNLSNPLSSPLATKKDFVLSPLSRIAKGVQVLGMNLRSGNIPRASSGSSTGSVPPKRRSSPRGSLDALESQLLQQKKSECRSKIIEL